MTLLFIYVFAVLSLIIGVDFAQAQIYAGNGTSLNMSEVSLLGMVIVDVSR